MQYRNSTQALYGLLKLLDRKGVKVEVRGSITKELTGLVIETDRPEERVYLMPYRNDNIFAKIAETIWMLAGRSDIGWLSYYLPRAPEFSDDGLNWRGAYGPRLRNWSGVDQWKYVIDLLLNRDIYSRQAIMTIWNPVVDTLPGKDIPCNNWIQFLVRDAPAIADEMYKAHMHITQRSCDALWGYSGIDTFTWSVLHEIVAYNTGSMIGPSAHFIGSFHLYDRHWGIADKIRGAFASDMYSLGVKSLPIKMDWYDLDNWLEDILEIEESFRANSWDYSWPDIHDRYEDPFLAGCAKMLFIYSCMKDDYQMETTVRCIQELEPMTDFRLAAIVYAARHYKVDLREFHKMCNLYDNETMVLALMGMYRVARGGRE